MKRIMIFTTILTAIFFLSLTQIAAQEKPAEMKKKTAKSVDSLKAEVKKAKSHKCTDDCDHSKNMDSTTIHSDHSKMMHHKMEKAESSQSEQMIHVGKIDVSNIDKNKDNFVFECPMDWNVISDKAGNCPTCGMKLKKYSVEETKKNLVKYGYDLK